MGTFCLAKKDVSRENKLRWREKKRSCRAAEEKGVEYGGGWVVTAYRGHWLPELQGKSQKSKHHGHRKVFMQLLQGKPNAPVHNVQ